MRIITPDQEIAMRKNRVYCLIVNTPRPDFSQLRKESDEFERWISNEHRKEKMKAAVGGQRTMR